MTLPTHHAREADRESKIPDGVVALTHSEVREHMTSNADVWEPDTQL